MKNILLTLFLIAFFLVANLSFGVVDYGRLLSLEYQNISNGYVQNITLNPPKSRSINYKLIYGNKRYGYFSLQINNGKNKKIEFPLVPPGYLDPIEFYIRQNNKVIYLESIKFTNPTPSLFNHLIPRPVSGRGRSTPYLLLNSSFERVGVVMANSNKDQRQEAINKGAETSSLLFAFILNRWDEIVWIRTLADSKMSRRGGFIIAKPTGKNRYSFLAHGNTPYFETVDIFGHIYHQMASYLSEKIEAHHDFEYLGGDEYLILSYENSRKWGYFGLFAEPLPTKGTVIKKINFKTGKEENIWSWKSIEPDFLYPAKDYMEEHGISQDKRYDIDHSNALQKVGETGYLLSIRNSTSVVFLSPDFKKTLWSIGKGKYNSYQITDPDSQFYHQHSTQLLDNGNLLLFDNNPVKKRSRVLEFVLNPESKQVTKSRSFYPKQPLYSEVKGSGYLVNKKNILALFPEGLYTTNAPAHLVEFDYVTGEEKHHSIIQDQFVGTPYRAIPLNELGDEFFLGYEKPR